MRTPEGVSVENFRGRLRLRWRFEGRRYSLSLGLDATKVNWGQARRAAALIEGDIALGRFDPTLARYRPFSSKAGKPEISVPDLFAKWTAWIAGEKGLAPRSIEARYKPLESALRKYLDISAAQLTEAKARDFAAICAEKLSAGTAKSRLWLLQSCWDWAQARFHLPGANPWKGLAAKIRNQEPKRVKPFSEVEIRAILAGFRASKGYGHYYPVVHFLVTTGCRPGEAFALRWQSVADDFSHVVIWESVSRGHRRNTTKTGRSRVIFLGAGMAQLLQARKLTQNPTPDQSRPWAGRSTTTIFPVAPGNRYWNRWECPTGIFTPCDIPPLAMH